MVPLGREPCGPDGLTAQRPRDAAYAGHGVVDGLGVRPASGRGPGGRAERAQARVVTSA